MSKPDTLASLARELIAEACENEANPLGGEVCSCHYIAARFSAVLGGVVERANPLVVYMLKSLKETPFSERPNGETKVRIYSKEHYTWWRANANGNTINIKEAGIFTFAEAWRLSSHCEDSKEIEYEVLP